MWHSSLLSSDRASSSRFAQRYRCVMLSRYSSEKCHTRRMWVGGSKQQQDCRLLSGLANSHQHSIYVYKWLSVLSPLSSPLISHCTALASRGSRERFETVLDGKICLSYYFLMKHLDPWGHLGSARVCLREVRQLSVICGTNVLKIWDLLRRSVAVIQCWKHCCGLLDSKSTDLLNYFLLLYSSLCYCGVFHYCFVAFSAF